MTDTTTTEVVYLDPKAIEPHPDNARKKLRDIDALTESVRAMGVIQPITVKAVNGSGSYQVIAGHRRRAAAERAEIKVPAIVLDETRDAQAIALVMLTENEARDDLSTAERVRAVQVALDLGASLDDVATVTGVTVDEVTAVAGLRESKVATGLAERHDLTLEQAMVMAEFDGDKEALKTLTHTAVKNPDRWDHEVAWLRRKKREREEFDAAVAQYTEEGATIVGPDVLTKKSLPLGRLTNPKAKGNNHLTPAQHRKCPHRVIVVGPEYHGGPDRVVEFCLDPKAGGHADTWAQRTGTSTSSASGGSETPADDETAKEARRKVLANNRALDVANGVRREYVTKLLGRRKVTGSVQFVMHVILTDFEVLSSLKVDTWEELTGVKAKDKGWRWREKYTAQLLGKTAGDIDRTQVAFGMVIASIESTIDKTTWRTDLPRFADYLSFLKGTGYTLSDVEAEVVATAKGKK